MSSRLMRLALLVVCCLPISSRAADAPVPPDHAIVAGYERLFAKPDVDAVTGGRLLLEELNCTSCHKPTGPIAAQLKAKPAPVLDKLGERAQLGWLERFLVSPHARKPGTTMPDVFTALPEAEQKDNITALVHLLAKTGSVAEAMGDTASVKRGDELFHKVGCVACHAPTKAVAAPANAAPLNSVPLGNLAAKYTLPSLAAFLKDPLSVRHGGRMPSLNLDDKQARDLACFFFKDVKVASNVNFAYYEGDWSKLPDFSTLKPKTKGQAAGFDLEVAERKNSFAMQFSGFIHVPKEGKYKFHLGSDDGSRLLIDGQLVVDHDGVHPHSEKSAERQLQKGVVPFVVDYFQGGGEWTVTVEIESKGLPRQLLSNLTTPTPEPATKSIEKDGQLFVLNDELAAKGKLVFTQFGCAACHQLKLGNEQVKAEKPAKPLFELANFSAGCLSAAPVKGTPHYHLNAQQRQHLEAAIKGLPTAGERTPEQVAAYSLAQFNCVACHERGKVGGVEEGRNAFFETTMKEMGDEGRIPPALDGVGDKLNEGYFKNLLNNGAKDRGYMLTVMPKFAGQNVGHLFDAFRKLDEKTEAQFVEHTDSVGQMKAGGRKLVGEKGLGCIKCHPFDKNVATGIQAMDLTKMAGRLRHDWFHRYMENPQTFRPGTRMPAPWPFGNVSIKDVLDADGTKQKQAVWLYLTDGTGAGIPAGVQKEAIVLTPTTEPIVYRNFIEGVSPRAIAVGYPEKINLCFDAESMSLALLWQNEFIDAGKHWIGRGPGNQRPLGDNVLSLPKGVSIATLDKPDAAWPTTPAAEQGYLFRGYRYNELRQPTFLYSQGDLQISDECVPVPSGRTKQFDFRRTLILKSPASGSTVTYRAALGSKIEQQGDVYIIDTHLKLKVSSSTGKPRLRQINGKTELLLDVELKNGEAKIEQTYSW